ncbi:hypothetical protein DBR32_09990 [Taibaiella sp. KBW10]|uniref:FUSC family protein n=1 Tax=Taibaiella sp. KBW10 TaxID=2153357 RepID=UPI000F5AD734|nr:FUSC family protein [Taibaiella sp. KBW10]RQO31028.1 hypothetical protein DBR32_09990 [Taibaiella sp. KBW10]
MGINTQLQNFKNRLANEIVEPAWGWGFRVAISVTLPVLLSIFSGNPNYFWMVIAGETVSIVELKGSAGFRSRLLIAAVIFAVLFTIIGGLAGGHLWWSVLLMFPIALGCGLMKNLGDWGLGLAINIYLFYLISSSHPPPTVAAFWDRIYFVGLGGLWALCVGVFSFSFLPQGKPYRRTIAHIWKAVENLMVLVSNDWDLGTKKSSIRAIYLKEKEIRTAIDASLALYGNLYDEKKQQPENERKLSYARRCASMASLQIISITNNAALLFKKPLSQAFIIQMHTILKVLEQLSNRMGFYFYTIKEEELLLIQSRLERLNKFKTNLSTFEESKIPECERIIHHINRFAHLVELSVKTVSSEKEKMMISQYSLMQTLNILHPKHLQNNIRQFLNFDNLTLRYALRMAITATLGLGLAMFYFPNHGYWLPLTIIIVSQPFFGATLKKGIQRSVGTIAGVILGSLIMIAPYAHITKHFMVVFGAILMIYNLRKNYSWAAFFITIFLIGLLSTENQVSNALLIERIISTALGAAMAIISGFLLFPSWDKKLLPNYLGKAVAANYKYFQFLFNAQVSEQEQKPWVVYKIAAESSNSNAFDSLNRYITEPKYRSKNVGAAYFTAITYNIRITRELNAFIDEKEAIDTDANLITGAPLKPLLLQIDTLFKHTIALLKTNYAIEIDEYTLYPTAQYDVLNISAQQKINLERLHIELSALYASLEH